MDKQPKDPTTGLRPAGDSPIAEPAAPLPMDQRPTPKWAQQMIDGLRATDPDNPPETP